MDVFPGWEGYVKKIETNWRETVLPEDTVVLPGDLSWGLSLEQALPDFALIERLPGKKVLLKGNHDYWWCTRKKMEEFFAEHRLNSLQILHNSCVVCEGMALCGSRGWIFENGQPFDEKIIRREAMRLESSVAAAVKTGLEPVVFLHYPPLYGEQESAQILDVLVRHRVRRCYYGHIHASGFRWAVQGAYMGIHFALCSADYLRFAPLAVEPV